MQKGDSASRVHSGSGKLLFSAHFYEHLKAENLQIFNYVHNFSEIKDFQKN